MGTRDTAYTKAVRFKKKKTHKMQITLRELKDTLWLKDGLYQETAKRRGCRDQPERPCSVTLF